MVISGAENCVMSYNTISNVGSAAIRMIANGQFKKLIIEHNLIEKYMMYVSDTGALSAFLNDGGGTEIRYNYITAAGISTNAGDLTSHQHPKLICMLYIDSFCSGYNVHHNIVDAAGVANNGLQANLFQENSSWVNNTVLNATSAGFAFFGAIRDRTYFKNVKVYNNLFVNCANSYSGNWCTPMGPSVSNASDPFVFHGKNGTCTIANGGVFDLTGSSGGTITQGPDTIMSGGNLSQSITAGANLTAFVNSGYKPTRQAVGNGTAAVTAGVPYATPDIGAIGASGSMFKYGADWQLK